MPAPMTSRSPALATMVAQHGTDGGGRGGAGAVRAMVFIAVNDLLALGMGQKMPEKLVRWAGVPVWRGRTSIYDLNTATNPSVAGDSPTIAYHKGCRWYSTFRCE